MTRQLSLPRDRISVLLLEGISQTAVDYFSSSGYTNLILLPKALDDRDLRSHIADAHIIGIRSRTQLTDEILESAKKLIAVGCFSVGTNQVDLDGSAAARHSGVQCTLFKHAIGGRACDRRDYHADTADLSALDFRASRWVGEVRCRQPGGPRQNARHCRLRQYRIAAQRACRKHGHGRALLRSFRSAAPGQFGVDGFAR